MYGPRVSAFANELVQEIIKGQDTGAIVASLDILIAAWINESDLAVTLRDTTIILDVVRRGAHFARPLSPAPHWNCG